MKLKTNKLTALLLALAMLLALTGSASAAYLGDINRDGKVNSTDARTVLRLAARLEEATDEQTRFGDVNGNGKLDASDARIILRMAANLEPLVEFDETGTETPTVTTTEPTAPPTTEAPSTEAPTTSTNPPAETTEVPLPFDPDEVGNPEYDANGEKYRPFSCGFPHHRCATLAAHRALVEREEEGCPYCGAHDCPSFYALDEWGWAVGDKTLCPKYDEHKDPGVYCEYCGKKIGTGQNGTCERFFVDQECEYCGEWVKAFTCHTCKH